MSDSGIAFTLSMLSAKDIARLHDTSGPVGSTADRAAADREWTYAHVVVDEAQELSPMAWRSIFRRCPLKSMTVVGDVAQTSDAAGSSNWAKALNPHALDRWRLTELTVNYRTPREIMDLATPVLAAIDPQLTAPSSMRDAGSRPWAVRAPDASSLPDAVATAVATEIADMPAGQLAVLHASADARIASGSAATTPEAAALLAAVQRVASDAVDSAGPGHRVVVLDVREAKGLEFDRVILVEPAEMVADGPHGLGDLYVAMTRATTALGIVYAKPLPTVIDTALVEKRSLAEAGDAGVGVGT